MHGLTPGVWREAQGGVVHGATVSRVTAVALGLGVPWLHKMLPLRGGRRNLLGRYKREGEGDYDESA
jgi:hypothetical protein